MVVSQPLQLVLILAEQNANSCNVDARGSKNVKRGEKIIGARQ